MEIPFAEFNWLAIIASIIAGQVISTVWFVPLFGEPWAQEYGATDRQSHTSEIPGYTYGVQIACTIIMVLTVATLQKWLGTNTFGGGLSLGLLLAIGLVLATGIPGQAFLKRWRVAALASGCQAVMIIAISIILAVWQ